MAPGAVPANSGVPAISSSIAARDRNARSISRSVPIRSTGKPAGAWGQARREAPGPSGNRDARLLPGNPTREPLRHARRGLLGALRGLLGRRLLRGDLLRRHPIHLLPQILIGGFIGIRRPNREASVTVGGCRASPTRR